MTQRMKVHFTSIQRDNLLEWAVNLETTDLRQGRGALRSLRDEYCCLGIYVQYAHPERKWKAPHLPERASVLNKYSNYSLWSGNRWEYMVLPPKYKEELGLNQCIRGSMIPAPATIETCLTELNDSLGYSFKKIAGEIRFLVEHGCFTPATMQKLDLD